MDLAFVIVIILYVVAAFFAFRLIKGFVKAFLLLSFVGLVIVVLFSFFVYRDVVDLRDNWPNSSKLLLVQSEGKLVAGFVSSLSDGEEPLFLGSGEINSLQSAFEVKNFSSMLGDNYKLLVLDLDSLVEDVEADNISFVMGLYVSKEDIVSILGSGDASGFLVDKVLLDKGLSADNRVLVEGEVLRVVGSDKVKSRAFWALLSQLFKEKGSDAGSFVLKQYSSGKLIIYPETDVFKVVKFVPGFVFDSAAGVKSGGEVVENGNNG